MTLVSKVYPWNAGGQKMQVACEASLRRLQTDYLDMYLLHWRGEFPLQETVSALESLVRQGKIRRWGVSNLDIDDMQALWRVDGDQRCATNQVLYHLASRGIERQLLPRVPAATDAGDGLLSPGAGGRLRQGLLNDPVVNEIADAHQATAAQILLAWAIGHPGVLAIPKAASIPHVEQNAGALAITLRRMSWRDLITPGQGLRKRHRWIWSKKKRPTVIGHFVYRFCALINASQRE